MKVSLFDDGCYAALENISFPVIVEVNNHYDTGVDISGAELIHIGGDEERIDIDRDYYFSFFSGECEVVNEQIS